MRRLLALFLPFVLLLGLVPLASVAGAQAAVTGTVASKDKSALGPGAVAVVLLVDQQAGQTGGSVVSIQRVANAQLPLQFSVAYDSAAIDPSHSYALYASVVDGARTLQTFDPTPVITGGPTSGVTLQVVPLPATATAKLSGTIVRSDKSALSAQAVAVAALVNQNTGTVEAYQVIPPKARYVNINERVLHVFALLDEAATALPDFTRGTGSL